MPGVEDDGVDGAQLAGIVPRLHHYFDADASRLSEAELRAMTRAREQLPKAIEKMELSPEDRKNIGRDIQKVEFGWPIGMPKAKAYY